MSKHKPDSQTIALETVRESRSALTRGWKAENDAVRERDAPYDAAAITASKDYLLPAAQLLAHLLDQDRSKEANAK